MLLTSLRGRSRASAHKTWKGAMARKKDGVYKIVEVVGVSEKSWEDAGRAAVATAAGTLRDLRVAEVTQMDMKVDNGKVSAFRTRVSLSFKYEA
jgi:dodecin